MAADALVTIGTDLSEMRRDLAKFPNMASEAGQKMLIQLERTVRAAEKAAKAAAKSTQKASDEAKKQAEKNMKAAGDGLKGIYELGGGSGDVIDKVSKAFAAMASPVGLATVGVAAASLAIGGFVAGAVKAVVAAEALAEELEPLRDMEGFGVSAGALASIEGANDALDTLQTIGKQVVVVLGAEFAPTVQAVSFLLVKLSLMALDAFTALANGEGIIRALAVTITDVLLTALVAPVEQLVQIISLMGNLAMAAGAEGLGKSLLTLTERWDGLTDSVAELAVDGPLFLATTSFKGLNAATGDYDERAKALIGTVGALGEKVETVAKKTEAAAKKVKSAALAFAESLEPMFQSVDDGLGPLRDLQTRVDELVPPETLSEIDRLTLLLLDLEMASIAAGGGNALLSEDIERVKTRLDELKNPVEEMPSLFERMKAAGASTAKALSEGFDQVYGSVKRIWDGVTGLLDSLSGGAFGTMFSASGLLDAAGNPAENEDGSTMGAGAQAQAMVDGAIEFVQAIIERLPAIVETLANAVPIMVDRLLEALPVVMQAVVDMLPVLFDAVIKAIPRIVATLVEALPGIVAVLAQKIPELLITLAEQIPLLLAAIVEQIPTLVTAILGAIPDIIDGLVQSLPVLIDAILAAIPEIIIGVIQAIPGIIDSLLRAIPTLVTALIEGIFVELVPRLPEIALELAKSLGQMILDGLQRMVDFFRDVIREIVSLGTKKTETFGDTPGPVRAGLAGLTARFAPGDVVVAARTEEGAARQLGRSGRAQAPASSGAMTLDLTAGHVAFDGLFRRNVKAGGVLATLGPGSTGRQSPYGRRS